MFSSTRKHNGSLYVQFNRHLTGLVAIVLLSYMLIPMLPAVLDLINPLNESRPKSPLYMVELYIDQDKYFYSVLTHAYITSLAGIIPLFGTDSLFSSCTHHACGMIKILGLVCRLCVVGIVIKKWWFFFFQLDFNLGAELKK